MKKRLSMAAFVDMRPMSPCKDCTERKLGCHSICEKYKSFVEKNREMAAKEKADKNIFYLTPFAMKQEKRRHKNGEKQVWPIK